MSTLTESERSFQRFCQEHTRKVLAQPLDPEMAVGIIRAMIESAEGEFSIERPLDLHTHFVYLRNTVRRQADELGRMRAELRERGSETERRQAAELDRLRQALELARGSAIIASGITESLRETVAELRAQQALAASAANATNTKSRRSPRR